MPCEGRVVLCPTSGREVVGRPARQERLETATRVEGGALTVYLAWTSDPPQDLEGPWHEVRLIAPGLLAVESTESLSAVYHALKWSLLHEASLIVVPLEQTPKSRGMAPGTTRWLRDRTSTRPGGPHRAGPGLT